MSSAYLKRQVIVDGAFALWLISTFLVALLQRNIALNLVYGVLSFVLLFFLTSSDSKKTRGSIYTLCILYCLITIIPLILATLDGKVSVLYYWVLGLNTLLAVKCFLYISLPYQLIIARSLIFICFSMGGLVASAPHLDIDLQSSFLGSTNLISSIFIIIVCWYCFVKVYAGHKEPILVPVALLIFALYLGGRGAILISAGIFVISVLFRMSRSKISLLTFALILPFVSLLFLDYVYEDIVAGTRLRYGLQDYNRTAMIQEYIGEISPITLLIGGEFNPTGIIAYFGYNPHNSIIRAHYMFGIIPIALFAFALMISVFKLLCSPTRVSAYGLILGSLILLRSHYDSIIFWLELDFVIVILLFSPFLVAIQTHEQKTNAKKDMSIRKTC